MIAIWFEEAMKWKTATYKIAAGNKIGGKCVINRRYHDNFCVMVSISQAIMEISPINRLKNRFLSLKLSD